MAGREWLADWHAAAADRVQMGLVSVSMGIGAILHERARVATHAICLLTKAASSSSELGPMSMLDPEGWV